VTNTNAFQTTQVSNDPPAIPSVWQEQGMYQAAPLHQGLCLRCIDADLVLLLALIRASAPNLDVEATTISTNCDASILGQALIHRATWSLVEHNKRDGLLRSTQ